MSSSDADLIKLLIAIRNAHVAIVEAFNAYLEAKAPPEVKAEDPLSLFPEDLRGLLAVEDAGDRWRIMPKKYLGSEAFSKVVVIVRQNKGDYVSAGRESHFVIPKSTLK